MTCPTDHKHAATSTCYTLHKCRCDKCREGNRVRTGRRRKQIAYGRHQSRFADAAPARAHIAALRAQGMTLRAITKASGLGLSTVGQIANGRPVVNTPTLAKILAVQPTPKHVPAIGAQRRLQALAFMGWTNDQIQALMNAGDSLLPWIHRQEQITPDLHARVVTVYDALWSQTPPDSYGNRRAAARARARGWQGPLAWNDEEIDEPDARPAEWKDTAA